MDFCTLVDLKTIESTGSVQKVRTQRFPYILQVLRKRKREILKHTKTHIEYIYLKYTHIHIHTHIYSNTMKIRFILYGFTNYRLVASM